MRKPVLIVVCSGAAVAIVVGGYLWFGSGTTGTDARTVVAVGSTSPAAGGPHEAVGPTPATGDLPPAVSGLPPVVGNLSRADGSDSGAGGDRAVAMPEGPPSAAAPPEAPLVMSTDTGTVPAVSPAPAAGGATTPNGISSPAPDRADAPAAEPASPNLRPRRGTAEIQVTALPAPSEPAAPGGPEAAPAPVGDSLAGLAQAPAGDPPPASSPADVATVRRAADHTDSPAAAPSMPELPPRAGAAPGLSAALQAPTEPAIPEGPEAAPAPVGGSLAGLAQAPAGDPPPASPPADVAAVRRAADHTDSPATAPSMPELPPRAGAAPGLSAVLQAPTAPAVPEGPEARSSAVGGPAIHPAQAPASAPPPASAPVDVAAVSRAPGREDLPATVLPAAPKLRLRAGVTPGFSAPAEPGAPDGLQAAPAVGGDSTIGVLEGQNGRSPAVPELPPAPADLPATPHPRAAETVRIDSTPMPARSPRDAPALADVAAPDGGDVLLKARAEAADLSAPDIAALPAPDAPVAAAADEASARLFAAPGSNSGAGRKGARSARAEAVEAYAAGIGVLPSPPAPVATEADAASVRRFAARGSNDGPEAFEARRSRADAVESSARDTALLPAPDAPVAAATDSASVQRFAAPGSNGGAGGERARAVRAEAIEAYAVNIEVLPMPGAPDTAEADAASAQAFATPESDGGPDAAEARLARAGAVEAYASSDATVVPAPEAPATAARADAEATRRFAAASGDSGAAQLRENGEPGAGAEAVGIRLDTISYSPSGGIDLSGTAIPGMRIVAYFDDRPVGSVAVDPAGAWRLDPDAAVEPGLHDLRIEVVGEGGVVSRLETPFSVADAKRSAVAEGLAVVQIGSSLWRIARRVYGTGERNMAIYEANRDQIRDPDMIFPGQILILPGGSAGG